MTLLHFPGLCLNNLNTLVSNIQLFPEAWPQWIQYSSAYSCIFTSNMVTKMLQRAHMP